MRLNHSGSTVRVIFCRSKEKPVPAYASLRTSICASMRASDRFPRRCPVLAMTWKTTGISVGGCHRLADRRPARRQLGASGSFFDDLQVVARYEALGRLGDGAVVGADVAVAGRCGGGDRRAVAARRPTAAVMTARGARLWIHGSWGPFPMEVGRLPGGLAWGRDEEGPLRDYPGSSPAVYQWLN